MVRACLLMLAVCAAACSKNIGDACATNVDCSPQGTRFCDTSAPGGYCTIDGCDVATCPSEAVCVRFFTLQRNSPCTYDPANQTGRGLAPYTCRTDERCLCDGLQPDGSCDAGHSFCAPEATERRWCQYKCSGNSDCRAGYDCKSTGTLGAEAVPLVDDFGVTITQAKFCAPSG
jgi:hypothetical protein